MAAHGPQVVFGIAVDDPASAGLVRRVMTVASVMATVTLINIIISLADGGILNVLVGMCILAIPACGYYGAKQRNHNLLQWFWMCNACCACLSVFGIIVAAYVIVNIDCMCNGECSAQAAGVEEGKIPQGCDDKSAWRSVLTVSIIYGVIEATLQVMACTWGNKLAESELMVTGNYDATGMPVAAIAMTAPGVSNRDGGLPVATQVGAGVPVAAVYTQPTGGGGASAAGKIV